LTRFANARKKICPNLKIVYAFSPPFRPLTAGRRRGNHGGNQRAAPDFVYGFGLPETGKLDGAHKNKLKAVMLGVGASFDFYAGNVKESPEWMGSLGLEWLFRLTQEPKRLWRRYLILNPRFMTLAAMQLLGLTQTKNQEV
jgi:N-acetylglucosaminyldiphosphoundecaprenol N-acetyl-beta-D-mannosaminyltransferase